MIFNKNEFSATLNQFFITAAIIYIGSAVTTLFTDQGIIATIIGIVVLAAGIYNLVLLNKFSKITGDPTIKKVFIFNMVIIAIVVFLLIAAFVAVGAAINSGNVNGLMGVTVLLLIGGLAAAGLAIAAHIMTVNFIKNAVPTEKVVSMSKLAIYLFVGGLIINVIFAAVSLQFIGSLLSVAASIYYVYYLYTANEEVKALDMAEDVIAADIGFAQPTDAAVEIVDVETNDAVTEVIPEVVVDETETSEE